MRTSGAIVGSFMVLAWAVTLAPQAPMEGYLSLGPSQLYFERTGQGGGTPIVLIHGGNLDSGMWDADVPVFARQWTVVRYDVRPYGRSGPVAPGYSFAEDLRALMDHLKIARAHLVALSLGGRVATNFAVAYPDRVDRLVLVAPGVDGWAWAPDPAIDAIITAAAKEKDPKKAMELWLKHPYMAPAMTHPELAPTIRALTFRNEHVWRGSTSPDRVPDPPTVDRLRDIRAPTLAIVGDLDVPDIQKIVDRIVRDVPGARKLVLPKVGHMVNMEAPAAFRRAVIEFLDAR